MHLKLGTIAAGMVHFVVKRLPDRAKRAIFVASLSANVKRTSELDETTLKKLNELMGLCRNVDSLRIPAPVSKVIWDGRIVFDVSRVFTETAQVSDGDISLIISVIKNQIPDWLRYGEKDIDQDLKTLIEHRREVFSN